MKVFKFGGASVKDAESVRRVAEIIEAHAGEKIIVVVSAMGKTTNILEEIACYLWYHDNTYCAYEIESLRKWHLNIVAQLFVNPSYTIYHTIEYYFAQIIISDRSYFEDFDDNYRRFIAHIVSFGERLSTLIVGEYLREYGISLDRVDAFHLIHTDSNYLGANVDWNLTKAILYKEMCERLIKHKVIITQGFIGGAVDNGEYYITTLGREGSDYSAAIFAHCMDAESVTIWKDVEGMFNADPKQFPDAVKLDKLSYNEATELAYYGASVIHPKTLKPLQNKNIPLYIKSFLDPTAPGTVIQQSTAYDNKISSYIVKNDQVLISLRLRDFSFIAEAHLGAILNELDRMGVKINLMQNSALSFSFVVDEPKIDIDAMQSIFNKEYEIRYNERAELITIRHPQQNVIDRLTYDKEILLTQSTRETMRIVTENKKDDDFPF